MTVAVPNIPQNVAPLVYHLEMISVVVDFDVSFPPFTDQKGVFVTVSKETNLLGVLVVLV